MEVTKPQETHITLADKLAKLEEKRKKITDEKQHFQESVQILLKQIEQLSK
jgi:hypothetical protein